MTKRHKHADMVIAKAENMDLVVFYKLPGEDWWSTDSEQLPSDDDVEYFAALPQHKDACLHWLNGGEVEFISDFAGGWTEYNPIKSWSAGSVFMQDDYKLRTKPRKEKLYIAVKTDKHEHLGGCRKVRICSHAFVSKEDAESYLDLSDSQLIEIEVEV